jgi:FkbM family methyltransferase
LKVATAGDFAEPPPSQAPNRPPDPTCQLLGWPDSNGVITSDVRVFLDIGSHIGESLIEVAKPKYGFDRIVCFEPVKSCLPALEALRSKDPRIEICPFGLSYKTETKELHNAGSLGGSVFASDGPVETIQLVEAADWFERNLDKSDFVVVKTNCEGSEVDIVNSLLDRGLMALPVIFLITFDVRDYPAHRHKELELRMRLKDSGLNNFCFSDDVMIGPTHDKRLAHWLSLYQIDKPELRKEEVRQQCSEIFGRYSSKSGARQRLEVRLKESLNYSRLPEPMKKTLRAIKRTVGLSRERHS